MENIVYGKRFVWLALFIGLTTATSIIWLLYKILPGYFDSISENRGSAICSLFFGVVILVLFGLGFYNNFIGTSPKYHQKVIVLKKSQNARYKTPYLFLKMPDEQEERFVPVKKEWEQLSEGDSVVLVMSKGQLGFEYIHHFLPLSKEED